MRTVVFAARFGQAAVKFVGQRQAGQIELHFLGAVEGDAHVFDEVLDVKAGLEIAFEHARRQVAH